MAAVTVLTGSTTIAPATGRALDHIGFEVEDLEAFVPELEARGM